MKEEEEVSNDASEEAGAAEETSSSTLQSLLQGYKEALAANDEGSVSEYERELEAISSERDSLGEKVNALIEEIATGKDRYLRLNADFDNYRKRAERDRLATAGNVKGEVIESLLPMVDNFERAKTSIKTETEGEVKIDNSYQGIYKQFVEIMKSLGVVAVETVGKNFDPNVSDSRLAHGLNTIHYNNNIAFMLHVVLTTCAFLFLLYSVYLTDVGIKLLYLNLINKSVWTRR